MKNRVGYLLGLVAVLGTLVLLDCGCVYAKSTAKTSKRTTTVADPAKKAKARFTQLEAKRKALRKEYDRLDIQIKTMEKQWLGVGIPSGLAPKYQKLLGLRAGILRRAEDLVNQSYGVIIQQGDDYRAKKQFYLAEAMYRLVIEDRQPGYPDGSNPAYEKAVGRMASLYMDRAKEFDRQHESLLAEMYWERVVSLLGSGHPKCAEANARLAFYQQEEKRLTEIRSRIEEPGLAGLRLGDLISKADELFGKVFARGDQVYKVDPEGINYVPDRVYYSREDEAWLLIFAFSEDERITDLLVTKKADFANKFTKDCGVRLSDAGTARGIQIGDSIHKAISAYGDHEKPTGSTLRYATGDWYDWAYEGGNAGLLWFGYDSKTKLINWIQVGMASDAWSYYK
jgi:hypothetical protein